MYTALCTEKARRVLVSTYYNCYVTLCICSRGAWDYISFLVIKTRHLFCYSFFKNHTIFKILPFLLTLILVFMVFYRIFSHLLYCSSTVALVAPAGSVFCIPLACSWARLDNTLPVLSLRKRCESFPSYLRPRSTVLQSYKSSSSEDHFYSMTGFVRLRAQ